MTKTKTTFSPAYLYPLALVGVPFAYATVSADPVATPVFGLLAMLCVALLSYAMWVSIKRPLPVGTAARLVWALLTGLLVTGAVSALVNSANKETLYELSRTGSLLLFFTANVVFISLYEGAFRHLLYALCLMAVGYLGLGLFEAMELGSDWLDMQQSYAIRAHLGHRNLMCIFYALSLPVYAYVMNTDRRSWVRYLCAAVLMITSVFLLLLASRVGWLGLVCFAAIAAIRAVSYYRGHGWRRSAPAIIGVALVAAIALGTILTHPGSIKNVRQKLQAFTKVNKDIDPNTYTINERLELWRLSGAMALRHPVLGVGPGMWQFHYPERGLSGTQAQSGLVLFQRPHNDLLWYACEYGIVGLGIFLALTGAVLWYGIRAVRRGQREEGYLIISGIVIFVATGFFDFPKERPVHLFLLSVYLAAFATRVKTGLSLPSLDELKNTFILRGTILIGLAVAVFFAVRTLSEYSVSEALAYRQAVRYGEMTTSIAHAKRLGMDYDLTGTPLDFYLGEAAFYQRDGDGAMRHFHSSLERNAYHLYTLSDMGGCLWAAGRKQEALAMWDSAIRIAPSFGEARVNKSVALFQSGDTAAAVANLRYRMLSEDTSTYRMQIIVIYGTYIITLARQIEEPVVRAQLLEIAQTDVWMIHLFARMSRSDMLPGHAALKEALYVCEKDKLLITKTEAAAIWQKYDNRIE